MKARIIVFVAICLLIFIGSKKLPVKTEVNDVTIDKVMNDFHEAKFRSEPMLMDPLILNAEIVKDRVIHDIKNPNMDKRRYAIAFLGNERIVEAIPALESIVNSESEEDYFRSDALTSIYCIDEIRGKQLAAKYLQDPAFGSYAQEIIEDKYEPNYRTKLDVLLGNY